MSPIDLIDIVWLFVVGFTLLGALLVTALGLRLERKPTDVEVAMHRMEKGMD